MKKNNLRSDVDFGVEWAERQALLRGIGYKKEELNKPNIAIINTWSDINPGHIHLKEIEKEVYQSIKESNGLPFRFNTIGLCDGIAFVGPEYVLPSRDIIVNNIEVIVEAYKMDAMVLIGTCDKIIPAFLMAAARLDIPAIIVTGGYMKSGRIGKDRITFVDVGKSVSKLQNKEITKEKFENILDHACPSPGACPMMGTANTMCIAAEAMGMSLPGNSMTSANSSRILEIASNAGEKIIELWEKQITARDIITEYSIENAVKINMAIGGSTNSVVHLPAVAAEAELNMDFFDILDKAGEEIPLLVGIEPNGPNLMEDFAEAGGLDILFNELANKLNLKTMTVNCSVYSEQISSDFNNNHQVIKSLQEPYNSKGGLTVLKGNIAPDGAVVKRSAVPENLMKFTGKARVFNSNQSAIKALRTNNIVEGDVVVIKYQGPKGGPGLNSTFPFTSELSGSKLHDKVAHITDGRFSGATEGACIGYVSPEAALYGPIGIIKDGDIISYDIDKKTLNIDLSEEDINKRINQFKKEYKLHHEKGYLGIYQKTVTSVAKGSKLEG